jgi:hypothetical protein
VDDLTLCLEEAGLVKTASEPILSVDGDVFGHNTQSSRVNYGVWWYSKAYRAAYRQGEQVFARVKVNSITKIRASLCPSY